MIFRTIFTLASLHSVDSSDIVSGVYWSLSSCTVIVERISTHFSGEPCFFSFVSVFSNRKIGNKELF